MENLCVPNLIFQSHYILELITIPTIGQTDRGSDA